ncbi:MAG: o-succinylbenzoate--CoA ligase [Firmicutes bacterium HGW-Firmicutes-1]|jgi:acyl-coenzyme A synthetase/AMP-(fatty) acid ligase|nr:MAG: o-succinylbenzoate--CoA ligase [Firmicutes bacterium HGW-Firmicutes-1]
MFLKLDQKKSFATAAIDDSGSSISYGELCDFVEDFYLRVGKRTLIFNLSENCIGSMAGYVACLDKKVVPLLIKCDLDRSLLRFLIDLYRPEYIWMPKRYNQEFNYMQVYEQYGYVLCKTGLQTYELYHDLSLLLMTSGSTGSPKLVRHSYSNIQANAQNVAAFFELDEIDCGIALLPMQYTMGLSVVTSHLYAGATVLLTTLAMTEKKFWEFIKEHNATSFTGVPYNFEVLKKLRFFKMKLPYLKMITQGGGKLSEDLFREYSEFAKRTGKKFIATYGQTEGTARMAYLPAELATIKIGSIGGAIPNGHLSLIDDDGLEIEEMEAVGEMVYRGPNVTLGYAQDGDDLVRGDERNGVLYTGDIARRDADGCYYIVGRLNRFLKLYGLRVSLDEIEHLVKKAFDIDCACMGNDEKMTIFITDQDKQEGVFKYIAEKTGIYTKAFEIRFINEIPQNDAGKTLYKKLETLYDQILI